MQTLKEQLYYPQEERDRRFTDEYVYGPLPCGMSNKVLPPSHVSSDEQKTRKTKGLLTGNIFPDFSPALRKRLVRYN